MVSIVVVGSRDSHVRAVLTSAAIGVLCLTFGCTRNSGAGEAPPQAQTPFHVSTTEPQTPSSAYPTGPADADPASSSEPHGQRTAASPTATTGQRKPKSKTDTRPDPGFTSKAKPTDPDARSTVTTVPLSTGKRPGGLWRTAPGYLCVPEGSLVAGKRSPEPIEAKRLVDVRPCFGGFPDPDSISLRVRGPRGITRVYRAVDAPPGENFPDVVFTLEMPLGTWSAEVTAPGVAAATATIHLAKATEPTVYRTAGRSPQGGAGLAAQLAGFRPHERVNMFLYGPNEMDFLRALPTVRADAHGEAHYAVSAHRDDRPGEYGIWTKACGLHLPVACATYQK